MTYELAQKLKDAGFPLQCILKGEAIYHQHREVFTEEDNKSYLIPLLSELIAMCPRIKTAPSGNLYYFTLWGEPQEWQVAYCPAFKEEMYDGIMGQGPTPEEAVADLWLALNKDLPLLQSNLKAV